MPFGVIGLSWPRGFKTFPAVLFIRVLLPTLPPIPAGRQRTHPGTDRSGKTGPRKSPLPAPIDNPAPLPYIPPIHPGVDWDALNRLHERGLIDDPINKTKSVILTEEGLRESKRLFQQHFVTAGSKNNDETNF